MHYIGLACFNVWSIFILAGNNIIIPLSWKIEFSEMRNEFAEMFSGVWKAILEHFNNRSKLEDLKDYLHDREPKLQPRLDNAREIRDILNIVREECTLTDITILKGIIEKFKIKAAEEHVKEYMGAVSKFCHSVNTRICTGETFEVTHSLSPLQCEIITFKLDWDADQYTIADVRDVIAKVLGKDSRVKIRVILETNSIKVICTFLVSHWRVES